MSGKYRFVKAWRKRNPDKVAAYARSRWRRRNEHVLAVRRKWRKANIERVRELDKLAARRRRSYKPAQYKAWKERAKARRLVRNESIAGRPRSANCELCGDSAVTVFDHNHTNGLFRGWLCQRCNRVLGSVKDDIGILMKMISYLELHGEIDQRSKKRTSEQRFRFSEAAKVSDQ